MTNSSLKHQAGLGVLHMFYLVASFGLILLIAFKIVPPFHENWYVEKALRKLAQNHPDDLQIISKSTIRSELSTFYTINNVRRGEVVEALEVERLREKTIVKVNYEIRVPVIKNIDIVVGFKNELDSSRPDECCEPAEKKIAGQ